MNRGLAPVAISIGALLYILTLAYLMTVASYDIWGALIVVPPFAWITLALVRRLFWGSLTPLVAPLLVGYALKLVGSIARYWVAFDAYGGSTDAERYHQYGRAVAGAFWAGVAPVTDVLPGDTGTQFVERMTAFMYAGIGSSKMAAFMVFSTMAWWGIAFFVKAACTVIPTMHRLKYAWLCALCPSLIYWPSSIGKEALMTLFLGVATFGIARVLAGHNALVGLSFAAAGLSLAYVVRAHVAGIWLAGAIPALVVVFGRLLNPDATVRGRSAKALLFGVLGALAVGAFVSVATAALEIIKPTDEQSLTTSSVTDVLRETSRRSGTGGSKFTPVSIDSPADWPFAVVRTLTRPTLLEAQGVFQFATAAEMFALLALVLYSWRRIAALPYWLLRQPYVAFVSTVLFAGGLAYSSFGNLGILARQKSLLLPFMLLLPCLPLKPTREFVGYRPTSMLDEYGIRERVAAGATRQTTT